MAGFDIQSYTTTSEVRGGNKVVPVREYHVISLPSETYFQFRRDKSKWGNAKAVAQQFADRIEAVLGNPFVTDVVYSQDTTDGGKLQDTMTTYYRTPDGTISGSVEQDLAHFGPNVTPGLISAEIASGGDQLGG
jgi:hypothetical protein